SKSDAAPPPMAAPMSAPFLPPAIAPTPAPAPADPPMTSAVFFQFRFGSTPAGRGPAPMRSTVRGTAATRPASASWPRQSDTWVAQLQGSSGSPSENAPVPMHVQLAYQLRRRIPAEILAILLTC